ncbi:HD family phosphohydrolase [Candidatus Omnitrophota bacterium]
MKKLINKKGNKKAYNVYHVIIALLTWLILITIIHWDRGLFKVEFREGDIALRDIYAPYDFSIKGEVDAKATENARKTATGLVLPVYIFDEGLEARVSEKAGSIINSIELLKEIPDITDEEKKAGIEEIVLADDISESLVADIFELKDLEGFSSHAKETLEASFSEGIISDLEYDRLNEGKIKTIKLIDNAENTEIEKTVDRTLALEGARKRIEPSSMTRNRKERRAVSDLVKAILSSNVIYDEEKTLSRMQLAAENMEPIYSIKNIKKNEIILNKGERTGKEHIAKLEAIEQKKRSGLKFGGIFAIAILVGLFMLLVVLYMRFYESDLMRGNKEIVLFALICILTLFTAKVIVISPWPSNLVPVAVASMLIAILINTRLAIMATCFLSISVGVIAGSRLDIAGMSLVGGVIGIFAMKGVRRRSQVIAAGLCVGFANMSYLIGMGLIRSLDFNTYITESFLGFANGIISAVIVTGVLPIFENTFKVTTDISLLELADLNHPLLKKMVIEAPGTYHHSLVVGNLAEAACEAIGANSLLARVGSYFHDIGKIEKASYFSENQSVKDSAHDKLSPTMSSLIITKHVKNGIELAKEYKLNRKIIDIINQHHGTGLVFYFFKRALEKSTDEDVGEQSFRYPGPKPQTKEAACVLLADSVEAASRTLDEPTPARIKGLVKKIINNKFIDGQLDECDLTLKDLERIAGVFTHILTGIFHTRVDYPEGPEEKERSNKKSTLP